MDGRNGNVIQSSIAQKQTGTDPVPSRNTNPISENLLGVHSIKPSFGIRDDPSKGLCDSGEVISHSEVHEGLHRVREQLKFFEEIFYNLGLPLWI